jgi:hypothetical protein
MDVPDIFTAKQIHQKKAFPARGCARFVRHRGREVKPGKGRQCRKGVIEAG